jgi:hypothetical protein
VTRAMPRSGGPPVISSAARNLTIRRVTRAMPRSGGHC